MVNKLITCFCLLVSVFGFAQKKNLAFYKQKYPKSNYIKLKQNTEITISLKGEELEIFESSEVEEFFLSDASKNYSKGSVSYSNFIDLVDVKASSFSLKKGKYVEHEVKDFKKKDEMTSSFHDDYKSLNFVYTNLQPGSKTSLITKHSIKNPRFLTPVYLGGSVPCQSSSLRIVADKGIELDFKKFNLEGLVYDYKETKKKGKIIYEWTAKDVKSNELLQSSPSYNNYFPHIVPIIKSYKTKKGELKEISNGIDTLYKWYYSLLSKVEKKENNPELVKTVQDLIKDKTTELEKVKAIYYWVQKNIKYVAFEYDLGGFIPREPNSIFSKKYGDCKDNSMILYTMLNIAGIKSSLTWIGTRSLPYTYEELPTPSVDNHMILSYRNNGKVYFLDATGRYLNMEMPTPFIQGKEALLSEGKDKYSIEKVPVMEPSATQNIDSVYLTLKGDSLLGKGIKTYKGYFKIDKFNILERIENEKDLFKFYRAFLRKGSNKFSLTNYKEHNRFSYDKPLVVDYDFTIPNYITTYEDEYYVDLNLEPFFKKNIFSKDRKIDFEAEYKKSYRYYFELEIPEEFVVDYLPSNQTIKNDFFTSTISYQKVGSKIIYEHNISLDYLVLKKENFEFIFKETKKINTAYKELIVLKRK